MTTPTKQALAAAEALFSRVSSIHSSPRDKLHEIAELVDRSTNLPELLAVAQAAETTRETLRTIVHLANINDETRKMLIVAGDSLNAALKSAQG